jgi:hypothetical protein
MFHLLGNTLLIGAVADTDVPALQDDIIQIQNSHFILPQNMKLFAAAAMSPTMIRARLVSPTLRQIAAPYIRPVISGALPGGNPNFMGIAQNPMTLRAFEETQILGTANPGTTERFTSLLWVGDGITPNPIGDIYPLRFSSTTAAVANAWTSATISFLDVVPSGLYAAVQSECTSTNAIAHRWIFSNQQLRPGFISQANTTSRLPYEMTLDYFGLMGQFRSNDLPRLQVLCNAADAAHEGYLYVVRVGNLN